MSKHPLASQSTSFIFNLEVLIEGKHNAEALEKLIHAMNNSGIIDYRIHSGIQLGSIIDERRADADTVTEIPIPAYDSTTTSTNPSIKTALNGIEALTVYGKMRTIMKDNVLIRLIVNKGKGNKLSIPCRIIHLNEDDGHITVYHVDEKKVYSFSLQEIEDYTF